MRTLAIVAMLTAGTASAEPAKSKLHSYYGTRRGYAEVTRDVLDWHKTRQNGCVAFASTALRHVGVEIPVDGKIDGYGVSRITRSFGKYLVDELGWTRIEKLDDLRAGDILFSTDAPCCPGYPNHVSMFDGWAREKQRIAYVVDNQGFHIKRPLIHEEGSDIDGFAYALRPPVDEPAPTGEHAGAAR
jgi:hypothetical protein